MRYYTAQQAIELLNKELPHNPLPYDLAQLADLCRRNTITPIFYYQRPAHHIDTETFEPLPQPHLFKCYLTSTDLLMLFNSQTAKVSINRATIYEAHNGTPLQIDDEILLTENNFHHCFEVLGDDDFYNAFFTIPDSPYSVTLNDLLFPSEQVQRYITTHDFADVSTPERQRIAELESQLAQAQTAHDVELSPRSKKGYDTTIGILFELLTIKQKGRDKPLFRSQSDLANYIEDMGITSQSASTTKPRFTDGTRELEDARKAKPLYKK